MRTKRFMTSSTRERSLFAEPASRRPAPDIAIARSRAVPSEVFDTYWYFAFERQAVFHRRRRGAVPPWTADPILRRHRFTNAYRASDRVSQYLIRHVIHDPERRFRDTFLRVILFKLFNRVDTWEKLENRFGEVSCDSFCVDSYSRLLDDAMLSGDRIYSAAYIMPAGGRCRGVRKHRTHLELLDRMMREHLPERIQEAPTMKAAFTLLREYPMMGKFLAYQYVTDLNYSPSLRFDEMEFVIAGPGARDGIRKCFIDLGDWTEEDAIRFAAESQSDQFKRLGLRFESLWGRPLQLIDCQNLFCEVDKYARARHPEIAGLSGRTRIKQKYVPNPEPIDYWYPPKWGLNRLVADSDA